MSDLKPRGVKAPLNLLPLKPLKAISGAMEHGAVKYAPWNWQDVQQPQAEIDELYAALLRHTFAASDPSQPDFDDESGLHHLTHAGACVMILLYKLGLDYQPSLFVTRDQPSFVFRGEIRDMEELERIYQKAHRLAQEVGDAPHTG